MNNTGLYIHTPFCRSKCNYCDFNSYAGMEDCIALYFSALNKEIRNNSQRVKSGIDTVYIGGGTPTSVDAKYICELMKNIFSSYNVLPDSEITIECNPGTVGYEGLKELRNSGINRLSIGLQSCDNAMLKVLGRIHSFEDFEKCFNDARRAGFENISADLMYGLPKQGMELWTKTLEKAAEFGCEHISCYSLKVEEGTPFAKMELDLPEDDAVADMYEKCVEYLEDCGYNRYEISNFAKPGKESRHNLKYWRCDDFLGFGAGAYSCIGDERFSNLCGIAEYITAIENCCTAVENIIPLDKQDKISEFVFLGLRCAEGISCGEFEKRFGKSIFDFYGEIINKYIKMGFLICDKERIYFADKGFFVSNAILADFV